MIFGCLTAVLVAASANKLTESESCVGNASHSEDALLKGSPLMQKARTRTIDTHKEKRDGIQFEAFVLDDIEHHGSWKSVWDFDVAGLTMVNPVRPDARMLNEVVNNGTIGRRYRSWYMPGGPGATDSKFSHEVGVSLAHINAWKAFIDRAKGDRNQWGLIFEGDATLRPDFWRWMRHFKDEVLNKDGAPLMVMLGHCYEHCYYPSYPEWDRDKDFCLKGDGSDEMASSPMGYDTEAKFDRNIRSNPYNVSGCVLQFSEGLCPTAYLISVEGATKMMELSKSLECAIDEKLRYEINENKWDVRIMCTPLVKQPWQNELVGSFTQAAGTVHNSKVALTEIESSQRVSNLWYHRDNEAAKTNICSPEYLSKIQVRTIREYPSLIEP